MRNWKIESNTYACSVELIFTNLRGRLERLQTCYSEPSANFLLIFHDANLQIIGWFGFFVRNPKWTPCANLCIIGAHLVGSQGSSKLYRTNVFGSPIWFVGITLLELKTTLNDTKNFLSNWDDSDDTPCKWTGITCNPADSTVFSMYASLSSFFFLCAFSQLCSLYFIAFFNISEPISWFGFWRNLPYMQLSGIISPSVGKLSSLQRL